MHERRQSRHGGGYRGSSRSSDLVRMRPTATRPAARRRRHGVVVLLLLLAVAAGLRVALHGVVEAGIGPAVLVEGRAGLVEVRQVGQLELVLLVALGARLGLLDRAALLHRARYVCNNDPEGLIEGSLMRWVYWRTMGRCSSGRARFVLLRDGGVTCRCYGITGLII